MSARRAVSCIVLLGLGSVLLTLPCLAAGKGNGDPGIVPPNLARALTGKTYAEWADAWSAWQDSIPQAVNPGWDLTGVNAAVGQRPSDRVFLITSNPLYGGSSAREVTLPAGKFIFLPVANGWQPSVLCPARPDATCTSPTVEQFARGVRECLAQNCLSSVLEQHASLDGRPLVRDWAPYRAWSPKPYWIYASDIFESFGIPSGLLGPCAQDGYYLLLYPMAPGVHTLNFGFTVPGLPTFGASYTITVLPGEVGPRDSEH